MVLSHFRRMADLDGMVLTHYSPQVASRLGRIYSNCLSSNLADVAMRSRIFRKLYRDPKKDLSDHAPCHDPGSPEGSEARSQGAQVGLLPLRLSCCSGGGSG